MISERRTPLWVIILLLQFLYWTVSILVGLDTIYGVNISVENGWSARIFTGYATFILSALAAIWYWRNFDKFREDARRNFALTINFFCSSFLLIGVLGWTGSMLGCEPSDRREICIETGRFGIEQCYYEDW